MVSRWTQSLNLGDKFSLVYGKLLEEAPLGPPPDAEADQLAETGGPGSTAPSPAAAYRKTAGFRIRKSLVLVFNLIKLIFALAAFIYFCVLDIEEGYEGVLLRRAQIVMLIFFPTLALIQLVGLLGILREKILLLAVYWAFSLLATALALMGVILHKVVDIEEGDPWKAVRDLLILATESALICWYLHDLYVLRGLRKKAALAAATAIGAQLRPMAASAVEPSAPGFAV